MGKHYISEKPISNKTKESIFPDTPRFPKDWGTWILTSSKGATVSSENLDELEKYPGRIVENSNHEFGYKFNILQQQWMLYNFDTKQIIY